MPPRARKRKSESIAVEIDDAPGSPIAAGQKIATKMNSIEESPRKRQKIGITVAQKQAAINNLQLEVTERARRLRAQYSLQAQGLRTRIEIRVNRIPMALRKLKMGDLLQKHATGQQKPPATKPATAYSSSASSAGPPVPEKDYNASRPLMSRSEATSRAAVDRPVKTLSDQLAGGDKENQTAHLDSPKKRPMAGHASAASHAAQSAQVLSPASSNARVHPRDRGAPPPPGHAHAPSSPIKSYIARPMSPTKQHQNLISSMVEKARAPRGTGTRKPTTSRARATKASATSAATPASRSTAAAAARNARRLSNASESSDGSTSTVVRKVGRPPSAAATASGARKATGTSAAAATKKSVMGSIKRGVTGASTKKAAAGKAASTASAATTRSGRILRKRD